MDVKTERQAKTSTWQALIVLLAFIALGIYAVPANSAELTKISGKQSDFLRITRDKNQEPLFLETAIVRYKSADNKITVDLVGVVHIGERGYYRRLNNYLTECESVLYELVAPEGTKVTKERKSDSIISQMQEMMQSTLGLEGQMQHIDYQQAHFVHADMSPDQLQEKMAERGDTPMTLAIEAALQMMRESNLKSQQSGVELAADNIDLLSALMGPQDPSKLKRMMASQFDKEDLTKGPLGGSIGQLIVQDRNAYCMKVLKKELAAKNAKKHHAIFYGAAHLPDMHVRLLKDFKMMPTETRWMKAWDLRTQDQKYDAADKE